MLNKLCVGLLFLFSLALVQAGEAVHTAQDLVLEDHVMALSTELRCLVCQNQTIADSNAGLAIDLRNQVRDKIREGLSDDEIKQYMVERYGDFVLYRPLKKPSTWLLWFGPLVFLFGAFGVLLWKYRQRQSAPPQQVGGLSDDEHQQALKLLADKGE
jgi:cytochrome c-type biogenesis protein CcmH